MHAHQGRLIGRDMPLLQHQLLALGRLVIEADRLPVAAPLAVEDGFRPSFDHVIMAAAIGDEIADRADLHLVLLREGDEVIEARHGAVVLHHFAHNTGRIEAGEARHIDSGFGMAGAHQHAAILGDQREDMSGCDDIVPPL